MSVCRLCAADGSCLLVCFYTAKAKLHMVPDLKYSPPPSSIHVMLRLSCTHPHPYWSDVHSSGQQKKKKQQKEEARCAGNRPVMELWPRSSSTRAGRAPELPQVSGRAPVMLLPEMFSTCQHRSHDISLMPSGQQLDVVSA